MEFTVVFEKSYNPILSDIDYWLAFYKGMNKEECEKTKRMFANVLIGRTADSRTVAEIAIEQFDLKSINRVYRDGTEFIKSRLEVSGVKSQKIIYIIGLRKN